MIQNMTLSGLANRLTLLEQEIKTFRALLQPPPSPPHIEFVIQADGDEVWSGTDLSRYYPQILREYPNAQISIGWRSPPVILI